MASAATRRATLLELVNHALEPVTRCLVRVDTAAAMVLRLLSKSEWPELCHLNSLNRGSGKVFYTDTAALGFANTLVIQQPTKEALSFLADIAPGYSFKRFHLAYDFLVPNREAADDLKAVLFCQLTQPNRARDSVIGGMGGTCYWCANAATSRNIAAYSDLPSKGSRHLCCHLEFKFEDARACSRKPLNGDLKNIITLDPADFLNRHSRLSILDFNKIEPVLDRVIGKLMRQTGMNRAAARAAYSGSIVPAAQAFEDIPVQAWLDHARDYPATRDNTGKILFKDAVEKAVTHMPSSLLIAGAEASPYTFYI